jgi:MYXO-CTERM domain-containing protein
VARSFWCLALTSACFLGACGSSDATIDVENEPAPLVQGTVDDAVASSCSTGAVLGLSNQIVEQVNCLRPNTLAEVFARPNLTRGANTFAFMQPAARDALVRALDAQTSMTLGVNSMLRTVAQQFLLYSWYMAGRCSIALAAAPGGSNHESGLALDTSQYAAWQVSLEAEGFTWLGSSDPVHFDYSRAGTIDLRPIGVRGFQRLWNVNHAADTIAEDGMYGPATESRLRQSPAAGFSTQAPCSTPDGGAADARAPDAADAGTSAPDGGRADTAGIDVVDARSEASPDASGASETGGGAGGWGSTDGAPTVDAVTPPGSPPDAEPDGAADDVSNMPPGALEPGCSCRVSAPSRSLPTAWWALSAATSFFFIRRRGRAHLAMARKASPSGRGPPTGLERS